MKPCKNCQTPFTPVNGNQIICSQRWLWERAKGDRLTNAEREELHELHQLMLDRKATVSGRTL